MNRIHHLVWNHTLQLLQVASEFAASPHGGTPSPAAPSVGRQRFLVLACTAALGLGIVPMAYAQTTGTAGTDGSNATVSAAATNGTVGSDALSLGSGDDITISGNVTGGSGGSGGNASNGIYVSQDTTSPVAYSTGSNTAGGNGGNGGAGVSGSGFTLTNNGIIAGGEGGVGGTSTMSVSTLWTTDVDPTSSSVSLAGGVGGAGGAGVSGTGFTLTNNGTILGGAAGVGGNASYRSYVSANGSPVSYVSNDRLPASSIGVTSGGAGTGGAGVSGSGFTIVNTGTIAGGIGFSGRGAYGSYTGGTNANGPAGSTTVASAMSGTGGAGVSGTGFTLTNNGVIVGGEGASGNNAATFTGLIPTMSGSTFLVGIVTTGTVGGSGGAGIDVGSSAQQSVITNNADGNVFGGNGGQGGGYGPAENASGATGGAGGAGMTGSGFTLNNSGQVKGGFGGLGQVAVAHDSNIGYGKGTYTIDQHTGVGAGGGTGGTGGAGGAGISGASFTVVNSGIVAGNAGGQGGYGQGEVSSTQVFASNTGGTGGAGGVGIGGSGFTTTNTAGASIAGGSGGIGGNGAYASDNGGMGGVGGAGVSGSGFTLTNNGSIVGGNGGKAGLAGTNTSYWNQATGSYIKTSVSGGVNGTAGLGGAGVVATGNATVINAGSISGGLSGDGKVQADAVDFSGGGNMLELETGYSFTGNIVSTSSAINGGDTLAFGGSSDASFDASQITMTQPTTYTGTPQYYGFADYEKTGSSTWSITGALPAGLDWDVEQGTLDFSGVTGNVTLAQLTGGGGTLVTGSHALVLDTAGNSTYAGAMTAASLAMQGSGIQILDGPDTIAGTTTVTSGTLEIGDANASATAVLTTAQVDVQSGGTLRGHGTVNGDVINDGIVRPGGSIGTLTINGNYTQGTDGTLVIDVTPSAASTLKVNGSASLAGTLDLVFAPGTYSSKTNFSPLQATTVTGSFSTTTYSGVPAAMVPELVLNPDGTLSMGVVSIVPTDGALYGNVQRAINLQDQQTMGAVLDAALVSPSNTVGGMSGAVRSASQPGVWMQATGDSRQQEGAPGLNSTGFGLLGGFDAPVSDSFHVGIDAGVNQINATDSAGGHARVRSAQCAVRRWGSMPLATLGHWWCRARSVANRTTSNGNA